MSEAVPEQIRIMDNDDRSRPEWDLYFLRIASVVRERSTCLKRKVGAVIVKDKQILSTGYNGAPAGLEHCAVTGCLRKQMNVPSGQRHELCRGLHAEQNAILYAVKNKASVEEATLYVTLSPCLSCARIIYTMGISEVIFLNSYAEHKGIDEDEGVEFLRKFGVSIPTSR